MKAFLKEVADLREAPTVIEHAPVGDSQANGAAERAVRSAEEIIRVNKLALEKKDEEQKMYEDGINEENEYRRKVQVRIVGDLALA